MTRIIGQRCVTKTPTELATPFSKFDLTLFNGHRDIMERIKSMSGWSDVSSHLDHGVGYA